MRIAAVAAASILLLSACASSGGTSGGGTTAAAATVKTADNAKLGKIAVAAADGKTLYTFDKDTKDTSNCYDACEKNWPPLTVTGTPSGAGVSGTFATTTRKDGTKQVTLDGKPLYYYTPDKAAGDVLGDGVGGVWHVVKVP